MSNYLALAGASLLPNVGGFIGSFYVRDRIQYFDSKLKKPSYQPPKWVFGPVWATLYTSIGVASYLVYRDGGGFNGVAKLPLFSYGVTLAVNWAWPIIYFKWNKLDWAFYEILLIDAAALTTGYLFSQVNKTAGYLFIPYGLWLTLATHLSYRIYKDNPNISEIKDK